MIIHIKNKDTLIVNEFQFKCCVGKKGIRKNKTEGDFYTPSGKFKIGKLLKLQLQRHKENFSST
mgnify:CR=1 FL=1